MQIKKENVNILNQEKVDYKKAVAKKNDQNMKPLKENAP
jgi:hypothetical protein